MNTAGNTLPGPLQNATYETLIGLLAATGLRIGEALDLSRTDVNLDEGGLVVRISKFCKSREIPCQSSTIEALSLYARRRDALLRRHTATSFFVYDSGRPLRYPQVQRVFRRIVTDAGIGSQRRTSPRIHDLRHTFAVRVLLNWYRSGENVEACLPRLSTYLGHLDPHGTYWYLSAVPELLSLAAQRLERLEVRRV